MPSMHTHVTNIIHILAASLYQSAEAFLRELGANSHDSIKMRLLRDATEPGRIVITIDRSSDTLTIEDNGLGMDCETIVNCYSTIGASGTRSERERHQTETGQNTGTIGRFGIGALAAHVPARRVDMFTKRFGTDEAWHWSSEGGADYELEPTTEMPRYGTQVVLTLKPAFRHLLDPKEITRIVRQHLEFLPIPIILEGHGIINTPDPAWLRPDWSSESDTTDLIPWIQERYQETPLVVMPIALESPRVTGVVYISGRRCLGPGDVGRIDIHGQGVLIREGDTEFLRTWAAFIRGFLDMPDLAPTAARDNLKHDERYFSASRQVHQHIVRKFLQIADSDPEYFRRLCSWHGFHLKQLALEDETFFEAIARRLPFATSEGTMDIEEYLARHAARPETRDRIHYIYGSAVAAHLEEICRSQSIIAIRAESRLDEALLQKIVREASPALELRKIEDSSWQHLYLRLTPEEGTRFVPLESAATTALQGLEFGEITVRLRHFKPSHVPALVMKSADWDTRWKLQTLMEHPFLFRSLETLARKGLERLQIPTLDLLLNVDCPLVQKIASLPDIQAHRHRALFRSLFFSALADARTEMTAAEVQALQESMNEILGQLITAHWNQHFDTNRHE